MQIAGDAFEPAVLCQHLAQRIAFLAGHLIDDAFGTISQGRSLVAVAGRPGQEKIDG